MNSKQITAYQCGECQAVYWLHDFAKTCCQPKQCKCGATIPKTRWRCDACKDHDDKLKWECAERKPVLKDGWLYSATNDEYFRDIEDFMLSREFKEQEIRKLVSMLDNPSEFARKYQVYLCKPYKPRPFDISDHYQDYCFEDHELPGLWLHAEQSVNDWIASVPDNDWPQMMSAIAWNGQYLSEVCDG
jgi:hypothetical protein